MWGGGGGGCILSAETNHQSVIFIFASLFNGEKGKKGKGDQVFFFCFFFSGGGGALKEKNLLPKSKFFPSKGDHFE